MKHRNNFPKYDSKVNIPTTEKYIPQIYWPIHNQVGKVFFEYSQCNFPQISEISQSNLAGSEWKKITEQHNLPKIKLERNDNFWKYLFMCKEAYIVDSHFNDIDVWQITETFSPNNYGVQLKKIRIIGGKITDLTRKCIEKLNSSSGSDFIKVFDLDKAKDHGPQYKIHDRFALLDNEIWHFGVAVGGFHGSLSAYSRGWEDKGGQLRQYLDKVIEATQQYH